MLKAGLNNPCGKRAAGKILALSVQLWNKQGHKVQHSKAVVAYLGHGNSFYL